MALERQNNNVYHSAQPKHIYLVDAQLLFVSGRARARSYNYIILLTRAYALFLGVISDDAQSGSYHLGRTSNHRSYARSVRATRHSDTLRRGQSART